LRRDAEKKRCRKAVAHTVAHGVNIAVDSTNQVRLKCGDVSAKRHRSADREIRVVIEPVLYETIGVGHPKAAVAVECDRLRIARGPESGIDSEDLKRGSSRTPGRECAAKQRGLRGRWDRGGTRATVRTCGKYEDENSKSGVTHGFSPKRTFIPLSNPPKARDMGLQGRASEDID
jgi:hypothetical protein